MQNKKFDLFEPDDAALDLEFLAWADIYEDDDYSWLDADLDLSDDEYNDWADRDSRLAYDGDQD